MLLVCRPKKGRQLRGEESASAQCAIEGEYGAAGIYPDD
jgi:hypothetical protein